MAKGKAIKLPDIQFAEKLNTDNLTAFTMEEVLSLLSALPKTKYVYGAAVIDKSKTVDEAKFGLKRDTAVAHLDASVNRDKLNLTNAEDRKAHALNDPKVVKAEIALIEAQGEYEAAKLQFEYADDLFVAIRKIATIVEKQLDAQKEADKYSNPYRPS